MSSFFYLTREGKVCYNKIKYSISPRDERDGLSRAGIRNGRKEPSRFSASAIVCRTRVLPRSLFSIPLVDGHCLNLVIEYLRPAVRRRALAVPARVRKHVGETRSRRMAPALVISPFLPPFRPAPSSGTCRHATMLAPVIGAPRRGAYSTRSRVSCSQDSLPAQFRTARQPATQTDRLYRLTQNQHAF